MNTNNRASLWPRWVLVNGFGEMVGLGLTFAVGAIVISYLGSNNDLSSIMITYLVAVVSGVIEASVVGLGQWWAMHPWFPMIRPRAWWLATLIGALMAYILGYLPSTLISLGEQASQTQSATAEPPQWVVLLLAAGLGAVGGAVLSFAQWIVLRRKVPGSSIWIPANMLAWMVGMPLIFFAIDRAQNLNEFPVLLLFIAGALLIIGMVVGAIHGAFLVRMAKRIKHEESPSSDVKVVY
jgi:hypothetical protein